jgi:hypothetical protein
MTEYARTVRAMLALAIPRKRIVESIVDEFGCDTDAVERVIDSELERISAPPFEVANAWRVLSVDAYRAGDFGARAVAIRGLANALKNAVRVVHVAPTRSDVSRRIAEAETRRRRIDDDDGDD